MGFKFPYGNEQQLNLNWFIKKFKELLVDWQREKNSIDGALDAEIQRAEDALADVYTARDVTVAAKNDALQAKADALTAAANAAQYWQNAAASANSAATSALTALQAAQDASDDAAQTSSDRAGVAADKAAVAADKATVASDKATVAADKATVAQDKDDVDTMKDAANAAALRSEGWADGTQNGTPVTSGSPYYENNAKYYSQQAASGEAAQAMIAPVEDSSTASTTHTPDTASQYFRYSGKYYKATTTIAIGDTITPNTNCVEITVSGELSTHTDEIKALSPFPYYDNLPDFFTDQRSGRRITIRKNKIIVEKTGSGSSYLWYSIFGKKYLGSGQYTDPPTDYLTDEDFVEFNDYDVKMLLTRWVSSVKSSSRSGLYLISKDPETGVISSLYALNDGFSLVRVLNATDNFSSMLNNGNFGLVFRTVNANNSGVTEFSFSFEQYQSPIGQYQKTLIASKSYQVNEFFTFGTYLYQVIQPIANGATIIPNTNVVATSITEQLSYFANNI